MAQYQITVDDAILEGLFQRDGGIAKLVESGVHPILQSPSAGLRTAEGRTLRAYRGAKGLPQ